MDTTQNLKLPYIMAAQAQKHVTHNEALRMLDAIVQLSVLDKDLTLPPGAPNDGDRYIVASGGSGDWSGHDGAIAAWQDGAWAIYQPETGWQVWVADENSLYAFDGSAWVVAGSGGSGGVNPTPLVGVNATAGATNRLSVASDASLFNHDGSDHRQKINKSSVADTASQLYQTNFSGRAEIGLTGDDDFHFKVSPDGTTFHEAIVIDKDDGSVAFPNTSLTKNVIFNLLEDAGRFAGTPEDPVVNAGSYVAPGYYTRYNGAVFTAGDKFIHNNTTYGGTAGALGADVDGLIQKLKPGASSSYKRYGPEFFVMHVAAGTGTAASFSFAGTTYYRCIINDSTPLWPKSTFFYNLKVKTGTSVLRHYAGSTLYIDGVAQTTHAVIQPSDGWVQVGLLMDLDPLAFLGYDNNLNRLSVTPSANVVIALPCLFPGQIKPTTTPIGVVPSLRGWR